MKLRINIPVVVALGFISCGVTHAQLTSIQSTLGAQFQQLGYFYGSDNFTQTRFRETANLFINGYIYHPDLAEISYQGRFMNSNGNSSTSTYSSTLQEQDISYYDLSLNILKNNNLPTFISLRREVNSSEQQGDFSLASSSKMLNTSTGVRFSPRLGRNGSKTPLFTFNYLDYSSKSLNPLVPLDQKGTDFGLGFEYSKIEDLMLQLDLLHRARTDNLTSSSFISREVHFNSYYRASDNNQLSLNGNLWNEGDAVNFAGTTFWNSQIGASTNNQLQGQVHAYNTPSYRSDEGEIRDHLNIAFSPQWKGIFVVSHDEGGARFGASATPIRKSQGTIGLLHENTLGRFIANVDAQISYSRVQNTFDQQTTDGHLALGLRTNGFALGQVSVTNQVQYERWSGYSTLMLIDNTTFVTIESNAIPSLYFRSNGTYTFNHPIGDATSAGNEKNFVILNDAMYHWTRGVDLFFTLHYGYNYFMRAGVENAINRLSLTAQIPNLIRNFVLQGSIMRSSDRLRQANEYNYDVTLTFNWRSVAFNLQFIGYAYDTYRRSDFFMSITRQLNFNFE